MASPAFTIPKAFGFEWLCSFVASAAAHCHNLLYYLYLRSFSLLQIGFVFSNRYTDSRFTLHASEIGFVFSNSPIQLVSDPRFHGDKFTPAKAGELRASDFRPKAG
ncbi:MAG: hypothetical protein ACYSYV_04630 [Planctomycetota bacterium]|jgi:hypothetical protein